MSRLVGKVAVITGGAGEIGSATAKLFVQEGAKVLLVDIDEGACKKAIDTISGDGSISCFAADVTKPEQVQAYAQAAVERYGGIDVFCNNAGIEGVVSLTHEYPIDVFRKVMDVNVFGAFLGMKYVTPFILARGGGSIIITSSVAGVTGMPAVSAYVTSKHALIGLMRSAALEYAPFNVRTNCINPSPVETRMMRSLESGLVPLASLRLGTEVNPEQVHQLLSERIAMGRYATTEDVARVMLFLASDDSRFCNGGIYMVDGGYSTA
jgi:NAD(P)-dependent dehydrogenase (short-subunit alcohol dehydrogenase family)